MEMTRKEILNSSEYWQERAETQCYIEGIECTIQLVDKQQVIDKAMKVICDGCAQKVECEFHNWKTCTTRDELIKSIE